MNAAATPEVARSPWVTQLLLFEDPDGTEADIEPRENGAQTAPQPRSDTQAPSEAAGGAEATGTPGTGGIPARCPVVGKAVCYYADCRHWQDERCAHPEAVSKPRRRRHAAQ